jgi:hypothetical protein
MLDSEKMQLVNYSIEIFIAQASLDFSDCLVRCIIFTLEIDIFVLSDKTFLQNKLERL